MLLADLGYESKFRDASEKPGRDVVAARMVAEVFGKLLLSAISRFHSRLDRYPRNTATCVEHTFLKENDLFASDFFRPWTVMQGRQKESDREGGACVPI